MGMGWLVRCRGSHDALPRTTPDSTIAKGLGRLPTGPRAGKKAAEKQAGGMVDSPGAII
jgi:hypothetical protein